MCTSCLQAIAFQNREQWYSKSSSSKGKLSHELFALLAPLDCVYFLLAGNSFRRYGEQWSSRKPSSGKGEPPHELLALLASGTVVELAINEADFPVPSAFNDLSLHLFPEWKVIDESLSLGS